MSWASVPALLNAQAVKPGRNNRPAAARNAVRRDKSAVFIAVASQVNQPEIMITAGAGDNAAVVTCMLKMSGTEDGKDFSGDYRGTDVFEKKAGKWMAVASQLTKVGKE